MTLLLLAFTLSFSLFVPGLAASPPNFEREMFDAINVERREHGLAPVEWVEGIAAASRERAGDVLETGEVVHRRQGVVLMNERLLAHGFLWDNGGENIARVSGGGTEKAMAMLMASPSHRGNILNPMWRYAGVGTAQSGNTRVYVMIFIDVY